MLSVHRGRCRKMLCQRTDLSSSMSDVHNILIFGDTRDKWLRTFFRYFVIHTNGFFQNWTQMSCAVCSGCCHSLPPTLLRLQSLRRNMLHLVVVDANWWWCYCLDKLVFRLFAVRNLPNIRHRWNFKHFPESWCSLMKTQTIYFRWMCGQKAQRLLG